MVSRLYAWLRHQDTERVHTRPPASRHRSLVASLVCADTYLQGTYTSAACTKGPGTERAHIGWKCLPFGAVRVGRGATAMVGVGAHRACQRDDEDGAKLHVCTPSSVARNVVHHCSRNLKGAP